MKRKFTFFAALLVAALFSLNAAFRPQDAEGYKIGDTVKDFSLKNIDGKMVSLAADKEAKGAIVIFSCNHCPFVIKTEDRMIALDKMFRAKGYPVITINANDHPDDTFDKMKERHKSKGFPFPYLYDESQDVAKAFGAKKTPHVYVLKKEANGSFKVKYIGAIDDNVNDAKKVKVKYVENAVRALLKGEEVTETETTAIGCGIKWKKS